MLWRHCIFGNMASGRGWGYLIYSLMFMLVTVTFSKKKGVDARHLSITAGARSRMNMLTIFEDFLMHIMNVTRCLIG